MIELDVVLRAKLAKNKIKSRLIKNVQAPSSKTTNILYYTENFSTGFLKVVMTEVTRSFKSCENYKKIKCSLKRTLNHQLQKLEIVYRNVYLFFFL